MTTPIFEIFPEGMRNHAYMVKVWQLAQPTGQFSVHLVRVIDPSTAAPCEGQILRELVTGHRELAIQVGERLGSANAPEALIRSWESPRNLRNDGHVIALDQGVGGAA